MKMIFWFLVAIFFLTQTHAQKTPVDTSTGRKWPNLGNITVSANGKFTSYIINNKPIKQSTLVIKSIDGKLNKEFTNAKYTPAFFTYDNKHAVFLNKGDSLCMISLGTSEDQYVASVNSFSLFKETNSEWLIYANTLPQFQVTLKNLTDRRQIILKDVNTYWVNKDFKTVLLKSKARESNPVFLIRLGLLNNKLDTIYRGNDFSNPIFNDSGSQFAFLGNSDNGKKNLYLYRDGTSKAESLANEVISAQNLQIENISGFSKNGERIFLNLFQKDSSYMRQRDRQISVDIWSYVDAKLQSQQLQETKTGQVKKYLGVIDIGNSKTRFIYLNHALLINFRNQNNVLMVLKYGNGDSRTEGHWNRLAQDSIFLVTLDDGKERLFCLGKVSTSLSADERFIVYYDPDKNNYYSYKISSGSSTCISTGIKTCWTTLSRNDEPIAKFSPIGIAGFVERDNAVLVYDQYDIWKLSLNATKKPINITNGFGKNNHIQFRLIGVNQSKTERNEEVILNAFDLENKFNGYYRINTYSKSNPEKLTMGPFIYSGPPEDEELKFIPRSILINNEPAFIVQRMSANLARNYFLTDDFKNFTQLTDLNPGNSFNWFSTQLIKWKSLDGKLLCGILYKPENLDISKKHPVIIHYYERRSFALNASMKPDLMYGELDVPYFVSNGYLVFVPDIEYTIGSPGQSAYNSIVSGAKYLATLSYVDSHRMGLQGHSFGGFETNYVITHSTMFAAAMTASGMSNFVSAYGSILEDGTSRQRQYEVMRDRIGASLVEAPDKYLENSPVLLSNKVTTPLLMMHNKKDGDVAFEQGTEFFTTLRRCGKRAWLLQYDGDGHGIFNENHQRDFTIRVKQFFDHYLKDSACPRWMLFGIPAKDKGIDSGYELVREKDPRTGKWVTPQQGGMLTDEEKKKVKALQNRRPITIILK